MQKNQIRILIAYDLQIIGDGLASVLSNKADYKVVDCIKNSTLNMDSLFFSKPDIVLFEFARWPRHYLDYVIKISQKFPELKILVLSELISNNLLKQLFVYIHGYILKTCSSKKIFLAIEDVFDSGKYLCPSIISKLSAFNKPDKTNSLTNREKEILSFWLTSNNNNEIARNMHISESTVRTHLKNIKLKSGTTNKIQMMVYACKNNILDNDLEPICQNCKFSCQKILN